MIDTTIVIPLFTYGYPLKKEVSRLCLLHYTTWDLPKIVIGSEGILSRDLFEACLGPHDTYVEYKQDWTGQVPSGGSDGLTEKFHAGLEAGFEKYNTKYVTIIGDDDFFESKYIENLQDGYDVQGLKQSSKILYDYEKDIAYTVTRDTYEGFTTGAGLTISKSFFDKYDQKPFFGKGVPGRDEVGIYQLCMKNNISLLTHDEIDYAMLKTKVAANPIKMLQIWPGITFKEISKPLFLKQILGEDRG